MSEEWRNPTTICTHNGRFHCDEVMATAMLKYLYGNGLSVVRTRDDKVIKKHQEDPTSIVIDVGHVYDHSKRCYDHHQTSFNEPFYPDQYNTDFNLIPLSSCGLIYRHYGRQILSKLINKIELESDPRGYKLYNEAAATLGLSGKWKDLSKKEQEKYIVCADKLREELDKFKFTSEQIDDIYNDFYKYFVLGIDAGDNGRDYVAEGVRKIYHPIILASTVATINGDPSNNKEQLTRFHEAVEYCSTTFIAHMKAAIQRKRDYYEGLPHFTEAINDNPGNLTKNGVLVLHQDIPIEQYLKKHDKKQHYKFIVVPKGDQYKLWTVKEYGSRFKTLKKLISEQSARDLVGDDLVFIHKAGFTGAAKTLDAATTVALASATSVDDVDDEDNESDIMFGKSGVPYSFYDTKTFSYVVGAIFGFGLGCGFVWALAQISA